MSTSQYCAKVRTSGGCITVCMETVSDCLCRYSSETWELQTRDDCIRVYKRRNERLAGNCLLEVDNFREGSVKMWGAISYARKTQLVHITDNLSAERLVGA
jgi:hypothetical protein